MGFAAQNAALEQGELLTARRDLVAPESLMLRQTQGRAAVSWPGRWINAPLLLGYGHGFPLQRFVIQAAAAAGAERTSSPTTGRWSGAIAKARQGARFGALEPAEGREPLARPQDLAEGALADRRGGS